MRFLRTDQPERAFAIADRAHLDLHESRRQTLRTLDALRTVAAGRERATPRSRVGVRIGDAAAAVGVRVSALRHWENEGLLTPRRDDASRYRMYDADQMRRVRVVALLRESDYGLPEIRTVVDELAAGNVDAAIKAAEQRLADINAASTRCARATGALWEYTARHPHAGTPPDAGV